MKVLKPEEVRHYVDEGYVVPAATLPSELIDKLRSALDQLIAQNPAVRPERLVSAHLEGAATAEGVRGCGEFLALAQHPLILDAVEQLIGPDICLWGCQVFCKPAGDGMQVPMHQDGSYWPIRPLATCTVWLALDPSDRANGCLKVVPRSHQQRCALEHHRTEDKEVVLSQYLSESQLALLPPAVHLELLPGQFSMHDVYTVHGSDQNSSSRRRAGIALRYMPTSSLFDRHMFASDASSGYVVDWAKRPIFLVRGQDRAGNTYQPAAKL